MAALASYAGSRSTGDPSLKSGEGGKEKVRVSANPGQCSTDVSGSGSHCVRIVPSNA